MYNTITHERTFWYKSPQDILFQKLQTITQRAIAEVMEWWDKNSEFMIMMEPSQRQVLFDAHLITLYIDRNYNEEIYVVVNGVYDIIRPHIGSNDFYTEIENAIIPYSAEYDKRIEDAFMDCLTP